MTLTSLSKQHRAALAMLSTILEQNRVYTEAFGYPSGKVCPHCNKEVFASVETLEQLANVPGAGLAHDHCHAIISLQAQLAKLQADPPTIHMVQLPNPKNQEGESDPESAPAQAPAPAPDPNQKLEEPKEDSSACA
jgi:hypothetical protein